jgi:DNA-binding NtrC family response regulator
MKSNEVMCQVLIVDDDNDLCQLLQLVVSRLCPVHVEHTLKGAGNYLFTLQGENSLPKIILLDNNLPDGAGVAYIKYIRDIYPDINVIMMTADTASGLREAAICEGAADFITKPFRVSTINNILLSICPGLHAA